MRYLQPFPCALDLDMFIGGKKSKTTYSFPRRLTEQSHTELLKEGWEVVGILFHQRMLPHCYGKSRTRSEIRYSPRSSHDAGNTCGVAVEISQT